MPEYNWQIDLAYEGTDYAGWQIQNNAHSVQNVLNDALNKLFDQEIKTTGCSRTDAGVHALDQKVSMTPPEKPLIPAHRAIKAVNNFLPDDIKILYISERPLDFNSRFAAKAKVYTYLIHRGNIKSPFLHRFCWEIWKDLDLNKMKECAEAFIGKHDFAAFTVTARNQDVKDTNRLIYRIDFKEYDNILAISICGESFLYKMVRRMVGFMVEAGLGRFSVDDLNDCFENPSRELLYYTAQSKGLFLEKVFFDESHEEYKSSKLPFLIL